MRYFGTLYVFTLSQKKESGGYDAAVVHGSKKLNTSQEVTRKIKRHTRTESGTRAGGTGNGYFPAHGDFLRQKLYLCDEPISVEGFVMLATTRKNAKTFLLRKLIDSYSPMECASPSVRRKFYKLKA